MAAPIGHIFLALQMLASPLKNRFDEKEFILGTCFPDIRYLKVISREKTHFKDITFNDIKNEKNSFKAGMMLHAFVDDQREKYMIKNHVYNKIPKFQFTTQSLKFAEDQILYKIFDVKKYAVYFDEISDEEKKFGIDENNLIRWHKFLKDYIDSDGSIKLVLSQYDLYSPNLSILKKYYFTCFVSRKIQKVINDIIKDDILNKIIIDFYFKFFREHVKYYQL